MTTNHTSIQLHPVAVLNRLVALLSSVAPGLKPRLQKATFRAIYSTLGIGMKNEDSAFLNYGYSPLNSSGGGLKLEPADEMDRFSIQLYSRVAGARDLRGKEVVEIGCGRGGGASFIARYLHPARMTGVDLSAQAVRYCRRRHRINNLQFLRGAADDLPLPSDSFDAVVNVESSHCYPSFERFLSEAARVLRPNGVLLFADLRPRDQVARLREQFAERFTIVEEEVITASVLRALELDSDRRNQLIHKRAPKFLHQGLQVFLSVKGSPIFNAFACDALHYVRFVLEKRSGVASI
jgi:SAM-dependent methyltransferase